MSDSPSARPAEPLVLALQSSSRDPLLAQAKEAFAHGRLRVAVATLERTSDSHRWQPPIAFQESNIYIAQKDYVRACKTLDKALARLSSISPEEETAIAAWKDLLRLTRAFVGIFHELRLREATELAREVRARLLEVDDFDEFTELQVRLEVVWHKIIACEGIMGDVPGLQTWEVESARGYRLSSLRSSLLRQVRITELMEVLMMELATVTRPPETWIAILEQLLSLPLSEPDESSVHFALANQYHDMGNDIRCAEELTAADFGYRQCQHATGCLKARYRRATWVTTDITSTIEELRVVAGELSEVGDFGVATDVLQALINAMQQAGHDHQAVARVHAERISIAENNENWLMVQSWLMVLNRLDAHSVGDEAFAGRSFELFCALEKIMEKGSMPRLSATVSFWLHTYHLRHGHPDADKYARKALFYAEQANDVLTIADARCAVVSVERIKLVPGSDTWDERDRYKTIWHSWFRDAKERGLQTGRVGLAIHCLEFTLFEHKVDRNASQESARHLLQARVWIDEVEQALPLVEVDGLRDSMFAALVGFKAHTEQLAGNNQRAAELAWKAISACGEDKSRLHELACAWDTLGHALFRAYSSTRDNQTLESSVGASKKAMELFEELHELRAFANCSQFLALSLSQWDDEAHATQALEYLEMGETKLSVIMREAAVSKDLDALLTRQIIRRSAIHSAHYRTAVKACIRLEDNAALWLWSQRSKARALLDSLGLEDLVLSSATADDIARCPEAVALLQEERELVACIEKEAPHARYVLRSQHTALLQKMKVIPELAGRLLTSQSNPIDWEGFHAVFGRDSKVVFIDWVISRPSNESYDDDIYILVVRPAQNESIRRIKLDITVKDLKKWRKEFVLLRKPVDSENACVGLKREGDRFWGALRPLVEPLLAHGITEPEDLLVFCPTTLLYDIPLHAIPMPILDEDGDEGSTILLERNPVIYCHNFSILRQSAQRIKLQGTAPHNSHQQRSWNAAVFANPRVQGLQMPGDEVGLSIAEKLRTTATLQDQATPERFRECAPHASVLVYHGHAQTSSEDALDKSFLCLSSPDGPRAGRLTVRDIFALKFSCAPHVGLLACQTSQQDFAPGDEAMGLIPAFLFAGAASVLGSLWPVQFGDAKTFAAKLYGSIFDPAMRSDHGDGDVEYVVVDLARAMRIAALAMRKEVGTELPFHWAAYVLYGSNELLWRIQDVAV